MKFLSSGGVPTHHCFLDMRGFVHNLSVGQVPERLTQLWYEAENSVATRPTKLLGSWAVLVGRFWWGSCS